MHEVMKATWNTEVTKKSGERYTCDLCGKIIVDSSQLREEVINTYPNIHCFHLYSNSKQMYACSIDCVRGLFNQWIDKYKKDIGNILENGTSTKFNVQLIHLNVNKILNKYNFHEDIKISKELSRNEWNKIKKEKSIPMKS